MNKNAPPDNGALAAAIAELQRSQATWEIADLVTLCRVPTDKHLGDAISLFRQMMFPKFSPAASSIPPDTSVLEIAQAWKVKITELVCWAFEQVRAIGGQAIPDATTPPQQAHDIVQQIVECVPEIHRVLLTDVQAAIAGDPACQGPEEVVICYPGFLAIMVHRLSHELYRRQVPLVPRMLSEWVHCRTGIDVHPGARIGHHFFIDHGTGVVIGQTCEVGNHVRIYQGVTLGALSFSKDDDGNLIRGEKRHPTVEDSVVIYANSTILGGRTLVGHHSVIGSSVWLTHSVDPFTTVVMEKPRLRFRNQNPTAFDQPPDYQI